jgi:hypothetical protein
MPAPAAVGAATGASHPRARLVAELLVGALGVAALAWAWHADLPYCARHFCHMCCACDAHQVHVAHGWRIAGALIGLLLLLFVRPRVGRWAGSRPPAECFAACARMVLAAVLALVASEVGMRVLHLPRPKDKSQTIEVAIGEPNDRYGWLFKASKATVLDHAGGRKVEYAINAEHDRAPSVDSLPDHSKPSILFVGESLTAGHGLPWDQTYPALVGDALGLQVVNLGVHGYGFDQQFLRLYDALPTFQHPVAIVTIYLPFMIDRMAEDTHPHLEFVGHEPVVDPVDGFWQRSALRRAWWMQLPYRTDHPLDLSAQIFRETDRLARERGAKAFFLAPNQIFGSPRCDQHLLDQLFMRQGLSVIDADFDYHPLQDDVHPDVPSTRRLADRVIAALRPELASP